MYFYRNGVANRTVERAKDLFVEYISEKRYSMLLGGRRGSITVTL